MKLKIKSITPLHIGSGKVLELFDYIISEKSFYRLNQNKAFEIALQADENFPEKYDNWLNKNLKDLEKFRSDNEEQAKIRSRFNFKYFCESILNQPQLTQRLLNEASLYNIKIPFNIKGKAQVDELLKDADHKP